MRIHARALEAVQNPQPWFHLILLLLLLLLINIESYTATCQSLWLHLAAAAPSGAFESSSRHWRDLVGKELHILSSFSSGDGPLKSYVLSRLSAVTFFYLFR